MAEKISVEIALDGGAEVEQQLENIGKTGQQTFRNIQGAAEQVDFSGIADGFEQVGSTGQEAFDKIKTAAQNAAVFEQIIQGVKKVEGAFEALGTAATKMATRMTKSLGVLGVFARALGPVGIAAGVLGSLFVKAEKDVSGSINKMVVSAASLGTTVPEFDKLRQALLRTGIAADEIAPGLQTLKQSLSEDFFQVDIATGLQRIIAQLERMPDGVDRTALAFVKLGEGLGAQVIAGLQTGTLSANNFATALAGVTPVTQQQIVNAAKYQQAINSLGNAWNELKAALASPLLVSGLEWLTTQIPGITAGITNTVREFQLLWSIIDAGATAGAAGIKFITDAVMGLWQGIGQVGAAIAGFSWDVISGAGVAAWNAISDAVQGAIDKVLQFLGLKPSGGGAPAAGGAPGMAGGGLLGGSGTGTSDSNLAWVSRGEHIMPARAVAQPGVLSFLEALRRSGGNLSRVLDGMGRFALGGMVPRARPAYAAGGLAGGGNNVTIQFPGLPAIGGLRASSGVVEQLQKAAALAQVRSGGRKPSRYS